MHKNNYWYIGTARSYSSTPTNPQSTDLSGGIKATSPLAALDMAYSIAAIFGPVTALMIYELLPGGEIGDIVARAEPSYDTETNTFEITKDKDKRRTILSLPAPDKDASENHTCETEIETEPDGYVAEEMDRVAPPIATHVYPLYGDYKP